MRHLHWIVWAAKERVRGPQGGDSYLGVTYVDIIAADREEALEKARRLIPNREYYWVDRVIEHDPAVEAMDRPSQN